MVNMFFRASKSIYRKSKRFFKNRKTQKIIHKSYQLYNIVRVVRNPFILLEYINVYNGLILIGG